jgi:hypothetical protein
MKILKRIFLVLMVIGYSTTFAGIAGSEETNKLISNAIAAGNATALSVFFNSTLDLGIAGNEDTYSKTQATRILQDFFSKNPVKSYKVTSEGASNDGSQFSIGTMIAGGKNLRVYYLLKKVGGVFLIHQLQIQAEK